MTKQLIPDAALDKHVALLGMTGSGKTSVIKTAIVEPDLYADRRVLIITPKDDWWGLRLSKTGKSKGFGIPIFGGRHSDYPLQVKDAALLADTYGTMRGSAIFCTASLSGQDRARWFAGFAERLLSVNDGWVRVVIDEAHVFMPKQGGKGGGAIPAGLHAGNELVSQGRSQGLRVVLASQRSAKLHNDALTQCSCLFAMLLMAPSDREAVRDWIIDQADPERGKEIIASLANLMPGQAWVWAPAAKFLECVQFPMPSTFDSSAAPDDNARANRMLSPIDMDALKGKLATVEAERQANDPKALRAKIAELEKQIGKAKPEVDTTKIREEGYAHGYSDAVASIDKVAKIATGAVRDACAKLDDVIEKAAGENAHTFRRSSDRRTDGFPKQRTAREHHAVTEAVAQKKQPDTNGKYSPSHMKILRSLSMWASLGHNAPTREMVAAVAGYTPSAGRYSNLVAELVTTGAVSKSATGCLSLQDTAVRTMGRDEARDALLRTLSPSQKKLVSALLSEDGAISREELGAMTDYEPSAGRFSNLIAELNLLTVTEKPEQGYVGLSAWARELLS